MNLIEPTAQGALKDWQSHASLRRLIAGRWLVLAGLGLATLLAPTFLGMTPPQFPIFAILMLAAVYNGIAIRRMRRTSQDNAAAGGNSNPGSDLQSQLIFDIATLSAIVFFSGGATNPLISLLLPPVAIAALMLPGRRVAVVGVLAIAAYSLLMRFYLPLPVADASQATQLHLLGMWLTFAASTGIIGWLIVRMTGEVRARDAELAAAREQALRDERMLAMGTLAAGAAHELGTPLGTIALVCGELADDASLPPAAREDIALIRQQIGICKEIVSGLSRRAGMERLENVARLPADQWLETLREHWHAARPLADSRLSVVGDGAVPQVVADPRLEQAILNLLNNAANASGEGIELRLGWGGGRLRIDILDRGPGFPPGVMARGGHASFPSHAEGSGVGLMLTRAAVEQLGGTLTLANAPAGGALASIELPLERQ